MNPVSHMIFTLPVAALMYLVVGPWQAGVFYLSSFLIDFDHYLSYVVRLKNINPFRAYEYFIQRRNKYRRGDVKSRKYLFLLFHTYEFMILLAVAAYFYHPLLFVWLGFIFHLMLDFAYNPTDKKHRLQVVRNLSIFYRWYRYGTVTGEIEMRK